MPKLNKHTLTQVAAAVLFVLNVLQQAGLVDRVVVPEAPCAE